MDINSHRLIKIARESAEYCMTLEKAPEMEKSEFVNTILGHLPQLYIYFSTKEEQKQESAYDAEYSEGCYSYVDEEFYNHVRDGVQRLFGEDDIYLEAFQEAMRYSDTPVAASISEGLADIFQDLYNFISIVKDSGGDQIDEAFSRCRENFHSYWGQILCNLMRPLHYLAENQTEK